MSDFNCWQYSPKIDCHATCSDICPAFEFFSIFCLINLIPDSFDTQGKFSSSFVCSLGRCYGIAFQHIYLC